MADSSEPTPIARNSVRQLDDPNHGLVWRVTYGCACGGYSFRCWHTAMIFATCHRCPAPWQPLPAARPLVRGGVR